MKIHCEKRPTNETYKNIQTLLSVVTFQALVYAKKCGTFRILVFIFFCSRASFHVYTSQFIYEVSIYLQGLFIYTGKETWDIPDLLVDAWKRNWVHSGSEFHICIYIHIYVYIKNLDTFRIWVSYMYIYTYICIYKETWCIQDLSFIYAYIYIYMYI